MQQLSSQTCAIAVGSFFFPHRPWHISALWFAVIDHVILGAGDFMTSAAPDFRSRMLPSYAGA